MESPMDDDPEGYGMQHALPQMHDLYGMDGGGVGTGQDLTQVAPQVFSLRVHQVHHSKCASCFHPPPHSGGSDILGGDQNTKQDELQLCVANL